MGYDEKIHYDVTDSHVRHSERGSVISDCLVGYENVSTARESGGKQMYINILIINEIGRTTQSEIIIAVSQSQWSPRY